MAVEKDVEERGADEEVRPVLAEAPMFSRADMGSVKRRSIKVPLWDGKWAWAVEPTVAEKATWERIAQPEPGARFDWGRYQLEAFVDCIRQGPEPDSPPLFDRITDWKWLESQSAGVIGNAVQSVLALAIPDSAALDKMRDFFGGSLAALKSGT